jgi:hypothetical protein
MDEQCEAKKLIWEGFGNDMRSIRDREEGWGSVLAHGVLELEEVLGHIYSI